MKYRVPFTTTTSITITVEAADDATPEEIADLAAFEGAGTLCAQCTGWGHHEWSRDEGDELEVCLNDEGEPEIYRLEE